MIGLIRTILNRAGVHLDNIQDDVTIENRYPDVQWAKNPTTRRAQRRCFLIAECYRDNPELEAPIKALNAHYDRTVGSKPKPEAGLSEYAGIKLAGDAPPRRRAMAPIRRDDDKWEGIEVTAPASVKRDLAVGIKR